MFPTLLKRVKGFVGRLRAPKTMLLVAIVFATQLLLGYLVIYVVSANQIESSLRSLNERVRTNIQFDNGSRVHIVEDDGYTEIFDLATHHIPGMSSEDNVVIVTPSSPMAKNLYGAKAGETISWTAPSGNEFKATISKVDQLAVKALFDRIIGSAE